jgi:Tol biopolymer transport system component
LGTTEIVSIVNGQAANGDSRYPAISNDGRFVTFYSLALDLAPNDGNGVGDVFLFDRQNGMMTAVSLTAQGQVGDGESRNPSISGDGRFVAFESLATDLAANDGNNASDIFLYSRQSGSLERVSINPDNEEGNGHSYNPDLSVDGRFVVFQSQAENLWAFDSNNKSDIFVYYRDGNNQIQVERASAAEGGGQANDDSSYPSISADGRFVTFSSFASNLAGGEIYGTNLDIYVYDRQSDVVERISADPLGQEPDGASVNPDISADGRFVSFDSTASNLVNDDTNSRVDVFIRDRRPPVDLTINYSDGMPGSFFTVNGSRFLPDSNVSLIVNGTDLGTVVSDPNGDFTIILTTDDADLGGYILSAAAGTLEGTVVFVLDQNSAERPQEAQGTIFNIPPGIAYTNFNSMPVTFGE